VLEVEMNRTAKHQSDLRDKGEFVGRDAVRIANDTVELITLTGGGHICSFRLLGKVGALSQNVLWTAPWKTLEPDSRWSEEKTLLYGPQSSGKFLASYTGHALCLDYFGGPTPLDAAAGLSLHGEAAITRWNASPSDKHCRFSAELPISRLKFKRDIHLKAGESVAYLRETVSNEKSTDHYCDWVQHVTFGPPFFTESESIAITSGTQGVTAPFDSETESLLAPDCEFKWPYATQKDGPTKVDLRIPFSRSGHGFLAGVKLDSDRDVEFLLAINVRSGLGVGYCFRRSEFPWLTIWEENCSQHVAPWSRRTQARGMEFGTRALPVGRQSSNSTLFGTPEGCIVPARGDRTVNYLIFLFVLTPGAESPSDVEIGKDEIILYNGAGGEATTISARGCGAFLHQ
jgi:hypothetical protein